MAARSSVKVQCFRCQSEIWVQPYRVAATRQFYCSNVCRRRLGPDRLVKEPSQWQTSRKRLVDGADENGVVWRTIPSFPEYQASETGQVRRCFGETAKAVSQIGRVCSRKITLGYVYVTVSKDARKYTARCHRLIAEAFLGPAPARDYQVAHFDGNKQNNAISNLRWATPKENASDTDRLGKQVKGSAHSNALLTERAVVSIRARANEDRKSLAAVYGVSVSTINRLCRRGSWRHV